MLALGEDVLGTAMTNTATLGAPTLGDRPCLAPIPGL